MVIDTIEITELTIIKDNKQSKNGRIYIKTNLPDPQPIPPYTDIDILRLKFYVYDAEKYCLDNFPNTTPKIVYTDKSTG